MPEAPTDPDSEGHAAALASALPVIRHQQRLGKLLLALAILAMIAGVWLVLLYAHKTLVPGAIVLATGFFAALWIFSSTRNQIERAVLPTVCNAFGLDYRKTPHGFFGTIPNTFIPLGGRRSSDDSISGRVAGQPFTLTEVKTETGGKNSSVLFKGIVLTVTSRGRPPPLLIASEKETRGFLFFRGNVGVNGMVRVGSAGGRDGQSYGLWLPDGAPMDGEASRLRPFMERIIDIGPEVLGKGSLYSVQSTGTTWHIAIRHAEDLLRIGGLMARDDRIMADIRTAATEIGQMFRLIEEVLKAEERIL